jgi:N-acetylglucosaminyldiphosphoundecaprenol N-acetyl-beta-D-mannosaminyltransferase
MRAPIHYPLSAIADHRSPITDHQSDMNITARRRVVFLGCPVDCLTSDALLAELTESIRSWQPAKVIQFINANKVAMVGKEPWMGELLERADYVLADGQPMLPLAAMLGMHIPERIDGIGLMHKLLMLADREGFSVYLLGAKPEIVLECVRRIGLNFPRARIAGHRNGYFTEQEIPGIAAAIRATAPDLLFLGMGSPMKERLADEWKEQLGARVIQGVGGSFDVMAGMVKRAPRWMQRGGIEWFYRVLQEPRRMFWRYVKTNGTCLWIFLKAFADRWLLPHRQRRIHQNRMPHPP